VGGKCVGLLKDRLESKDVEREWMRRGRKSSWEGEQWIVAQEKEGK
jgi:hypothetical protein